MNWVLDRFFGRKLEEDTESYLRQLALAPTLASRRSATDLLARLRAEQGSSVTLGETEWGEPVAIPLDCFVEAKCGDTVHLRQIAIEDYTDSPNRLNHSVDLLNRN